MTSDSKLLSLDPLNFRTSRRLFLDLVDLKAKIRQALRLTLVEAYHWSAIAASEANLRIRVGGRLGVEDDGVTPRWRELIRRVISKASR